MNPFYKPQPLPMRIFLWAAFQINDVVSAGLAHVNGRLQVKFACSRYANWVWRTYNNQNPFWNGL